LASLGGTLCIHLASGIIRIGITNEIKV
jgi:hypothetical protein